MKHDGATALKSAQQKIDEVLDISDEVLNSKSSSVFPGISNFQEVSYSDAKDVEHHENSSNLKYSELECKLDNNHTGTEIPCVLDELIRSRSGSTEISFTGQLDETTDECCKLPTEEIIKSDEPVSDSKQVYSPQSETVSMTIKACPSVDEQNQQASFEHNLDLSPMTISSDYITIKSVVNVNSRIPSVEESFHSSPKSVSDEDIAPVQNTLPIKELSLTTQPVCMDEDFDTNTTGSDIEVISCSNSTNGGEVHSLISSNMPIVTRSVGEVNLSAFSRHPFSPKKHSLRGFSAPVALSKCSSHPEHRRSMSVGQDLSMGLRNTTDDDLTFAYHHLAKKFSDIKHLLNVREAKIMQLSHENNVLQNSVTTLQEKLKTTELESGSSDLSNLTSEFSQRLADAENRLQLVCRERDQLKRSLLSAKQKVPVVTRSVGSGKPYVNNDLKRANELERLVEEKNEEIENLLREGHKLAADQLKTNNIIKKLHSEQKEYKKTESSHLKQIEQLTAEVQRLRSNLENKEELLGTQLAHCTKQAKLIDSQDEQLELLKVQISKNACKLSDQEHELENLINENAELKERLDQIQSHSKAEGDFIGDLEKIKSESAALREKLDSHEEQAVKWREEIQYYQGLLSDAQLKIESLNEVTTNAAQPIMRQLEILQCNLSSQTLEWERKEQHLNRLLDEYKQIAENAQSSEVEWRSELRIAVDDLNLSQLENSSLKQKQSELENVISNEQQKSLTHLLNFQALRVKLDSCESEVNELRPRIKELEEALLSEHNRYLALEAINNNLRLQLQQAKDEKDKISQNNLTVQLNSNSGNMSSSNEESSPVSNTSRMFMFPNDMDSEASKEYIHSYLHLREGECAHLKREIEQLTSTQEKLLTEIAKQTALTEKYAKLAGVKYSGPNNIDGNYYNGADETEELQQRYETLLILFGKLTEENAELKLDLADVKEMYKAQIDMLLRGQ
ncbi:unnamed protein product [Heterobilharzia americana]|nr:unnamed protein product [Heterobilharzia americana]